MTYRKDEQQTMKLMMYSTHLLKALFCLSHSVRPDSFLLNIASLLVWMMHILSKRCFPGSSCTLLHDDCWTAATAMCASTCMACKAYPRQLAKERHCATNERRRPSRVREAQRYQLAECPKQGPSTIHPHLLQGMDE